MSWECDGEKSRGLRSPRDFGIGEGMWQCVWQTPRVDPRSFAKRLAVVFAVALLSACTTTLTLDTVQQSEGVHASGNLRPGVVKLSPKAEGIENPVGRAHTVFYIPTKRVRIDGDAGEELMKTVKRALELAGYRVRLEGSTTANLPLVRCRVSEFWFSNYTWMFPFVPTWGTARLTLTAESNQGVRWSRSFSAHAFSARPFDGFSAAANDAMGIILGEMVDAFTSDEFYYAVVTNQSRVTSASGM
jgi:hypothetical protein